MSHPANTWKPKVTEAPILLRTMSTAGDSKSRREQGCVIDTWVNSYYGKTCTGPLYKKGQWKLVQALIQVCPVTLAVYEKDLDVICGFACTSTDCVHYVWVEESMRRFGVAKELLDPYLRRTGIIYTHTPSRMWQKRDGGEHHKFNLNAEGKRETVPPIPPTWRYTYFHAFELAAQVPSYRETSAMAPPRDQTMTHAPGSTRDR